MSIGENVFKNKEKLKKNNSLKIFRCFFSQYMNFIIGIK